MLWRMLGFADTLQCEMPNLRHLTLRADSAEDALDSFKGEMKQLGFPTIPWSRLLVPAHRRDGWKYPPAKTEKLDSQPDETLYHHMLTVMSTRFSRRSITAFGRVENVALVRGTGSQRPITYLRDLSAVAWGPAPDFFIQNVDVFDGVQANAVQPQTPWVKVPTLPDCLLL